jgi:hypothetical protein
MPLSFIAMAMALQNQLQPSAMVIQVSLIVKRAAMPKPAAKRITYYAHTGPVAMNIRSDAHKSETAMLQQAIAVIAAIRLLFWDEGLRGLKSNLRANGIICDV